MTKITRQHFLRNCALGTVPLILGRSSRAAEEPPIVGNGSFRYRVLHDWGQLPSNIQYGLTHGVAVDSKGLVHVLHTSRADSPKKDTVVTFDPSGRFVRSWGSEYFGSAHGFDLVRENGADFFYLTDMARGLFKTTVEGKVIWHLAKPDYYEGKSLKYTPTNVAVAPGGRIFYADGYGSWYIHILDANGKYLKTFGGPGEGNTATIHPHGLCVDTRGKEPLVIVAENDPNGQKPGRLHAFNMEGEHHSYLQINVRSPRHFDQQNGLMVIPDLDAVVTLLDEKHRTIAQLGDGFTTFNEIRTLRTKPRSAFLTGKFVCPHDAAFAKDGSIFVSEWVDVGRVTKLEKIS